VAHFQVGRHVHYLADGEERCQVVVLQDVAGLLLVVLCAESDFAVGDALYYPVHAHHSETRNCSSKHILSHLRRCYPTVQEVIEHLNRSETTRTFLLLIVTLLRVHYF
jgi:hypothetical protein